MAKKGQLPVAWLRVFEVAARHLSFTAAADELGVTPSAVSQQIRLLEHRFKQALFHRLPRGLSLTAAGEALVPVCRDSFDHLDAAIAELFGSADDQRLTVRVTVGFARYWLLPKLGDFIAGYPRIPLRIVSSIWLAEPVDPNIGLEIRLGNGHWPGLVSTQLTEDEVFPVVSPRHLRSKRTQKRRLRFEDFANLPLLHTIGFREGWDEWFKSAGIAQKSKAADLEFDSTYLTLEMAVAGQGIALGRTSIVAELVRQGVLVAPLGPRIKASENLYLVHGAALDPKSAAGIFRAWLLEKSRPKAATRR